MIVSSLGETNMDISERSPLTGMLIGFEIASSPFTKVHDDVLRMDTSSIFLTTAIASLDIRVSILT